MASDEETSAGISDEIRLSLPSSAEYSRVVALTAAAIAVRHRFGRAEVATLQHGAGELFEQVLDEGGGQASTETTVVFRVAGPTITVTAGDRADRRRLSVERRG